MIDFLKSHWDKLLAIWGAILSTYTLFQSRRRETREKQKTIQTEMDERAKVLWETMELKNQVEFLDEWIWEKRVFTRKKAILDALSVIKVYWRKNEAPLRQNLGEDSRPYKAMLGLYFIALQNETNQPPPDGHGQWLGVVQDNTQGWKVEQVFQSVIQELKNTLSQVP